MLTNYFQIDFADQANREDRTGLTAPEKNPQESHIDLESIGQENALGRESAPKAASAEIPLMGGVVCALTEVNSPKRAQELPPNALLVPPFQGSPV